MSIYIGLGVKTIIVIKQNNKQNENSKIPKDEKNPLAVCLFSDDLPLFIMFIGFRKQKDRSFLLCGDADDTHNHRRSQSVFNGIFFD